MSRYLLAGFGLLLGLLLGAGPVTIYYRHKLQRGPPEWVFVSHTSQAIQYVNTLTQLRRHETDEVIADLEENLSMQLYQLCEHFPNEALSKKASLRVLRTVARYRSEHPFSTGNAEADQKVNELLAQAAKKELPLW